VCQFYEAYLLSTAKSYSAPNHQFESGSDLNDRDDEEVLNNLKFEGVTSTELSLEMK
jgi:hypothetical protein